jgi:M6 family metalloprotease-like protein
LSPANAQAVEHRTGWLDVTWREPEGPGARCIPSYSLVEDSGEQVVLEPGPVGAGEWPTSVGKRVTVSGLPNAPVGTQATTDGFRVQSLVADEFARLDSAGVAQGAKRYVTILCRFEDSRNKTPKPKRYYERMIADRRYGVVSHFLRASYGTLSLEGSEVVGWINLPQPRTAYGTGLQFDSDRVLLDAIQAASAQVSVGDFDGINLIFNVPAFGPSIGGWGGRRTLNLTGSPRSYGVTWLAYSDQALLVHEMGHTLGLPHSSGPYAQTYDSRWDVMSSPYQGKRTKYGYIGQDTIAYHKYLLGWLQGGAVRVVTPGTQARITLRSLCYSDPACYLVTIPLDSTGRRLYTVEVRRKKALDRYVPGSAMVMHYVDTSRPDRVATVVDVDNDGNPNDAAAQWRTGEEFRDAANAIRVTVVAKDGPTVTIDVSNHVGG